MKIFLFVLSILLLSATILYEENFLASSGNIYYDEKEWLEWSDFKGLAKPFYGEAHALTDTFAHVKIYTTLEFEKDQKRIVIKTLFNPRQSFISNVKTEHENLLSHENYHFKLQEVISRKLRYYLINLENTEINKVNFDSLETSYNVMADSLNAKYDRQTDHSRNFLNQKTWEKTVDSILIVYEHYDFTSIQIK